MKIDTIAVVGAGLAAARTITALRRKGYGGRLILVGAEPHLPYDRPPLSKDVLSGARESAPLPFDPEKLQVDVHTDTRAVGLDTAARVLGTNRGEVEFDGLVIATGADPVTLPGTGEQLTVRTIEDANTLRDRLGPGARVVVIGASWLGAEVTTAALSAGCRVTCLEAGPAPLAQALGEDVAALFLSWWSNVDLRVRTAVAQVADGNVRLADGSAVPADVVVTGIGVRPSVTWLRDSDVQLDRGVLVDEYLRTSVPGVLAVGDVAQRFSPQAGEHILVEHWDDAGSAAMAAAGNILATGPDQLVTHDPVPYFWSDQFGHKVQYVGRHQPTDRVEVESPDDGTRAVRWFASDGTLTAWLGVDRARELVKARMAVGTVPASATPSAQVSTAAAAQHINADLVMGDGDRAARLAQLGLSD